MEVAETYQQLLRDIRAVAQEHPLGSFNGLGVGGRAAYFCEVHDAGELAAAVKAATDLALPYEVIGSGSSILFPDDGYRGLIIHNASDGFVMATDRSQVVVESGMSLRRFVTMAAGRGYGGLTQFYHLRGSVGGVVYHGVTERGRSITSLIKHVTVLMPPTKMKPYPTVVRQKADWLTREGDGSRLKYLRAQRGYATPAPVILNVQFQLTSVRPDEIQRRLKEEVDAEIAPPKGASFGPVFEEVGMGQSVETILQHSRVSKLSVDGIRPDRHRPNFLRAGKHVSAAGVWACVEAMRATVRERAGIELTPAFERLGVW